MEDDNEIENYTQRVFLNNTELYGKIIELYINLLSVNKVDVVDKVTNIKQDIENLVYDDDITDKVNVYVHCLKVRLSEVYTLFGVNIDETSDMETYTLIPKLITDIEKMDLDQLYFMEDLYSSDLDREERFIRLLDTLYGENNIKYLEYIDISDYLLDVIIYNIYKEKDELGKPVNVELFNKMARLLLDNKEINKTIISKEVFSGEFNIELDLIEDIDVIVDMISDNIDKLILLEREHNILVLEIYTTLKLFENTGSSLYVSSSDTIQSIYNKFDNPLEVKNNVIEMMR